MAFNPNKPVVEYLTQDGQTEYYFDFKVFDKTNLTITHVDSGGNKRIIDPSLYSVNINGDLGGNITLNDPLQTNTVLIIKRTLPTTRDIEYHKNGDLSSAELNLDQDYQTYLISDLLTNAENYYTNDPETYNISTIMPKPNPGTILGWNLKGDALENKDPALAGGGTGGQYLGSSDIKAIGYMAQSVSENLILGTEGLPLNGFAIDSVTFEDDASLTITDGSVFKIL